MYLRIEAANMASSEPQRHLWQLLEKQLHRRRNRSEVQPFKEHNISPSPAPLESKWRGSPLLNWWLFCNYLFLKKRIRNKFNCVQVFCITGWLNETWFIFLFLNIWLRVVFLSRFIRLHTHTGTEINNGEIKPFALVQWKWSVIRVQK